MPIASDLYYHVHNESETEKPALVLIHGAGGMYLYWPPEIRRLSGYPVFALDLPGHGKSAASGGQQTISGYAERILAWLEEVGLHRAVFVGHSMGSAVALTLAIEHPRHVLGLGLVGAGARLRVHPDILENTASSTTFHKAIDVIIDWAFSSSAPERLVELARQRMSETRPSVLHGDLLACTAFDVTDRIAEIHRPTLVVCGADDMLTPLRYAQYLADAIPSANLEAIPDAGHMVMLEQPQAVAETLQKFLASIPYHPGEGPVHNVSSN